ncbi:hypothetical protein [Arcobacter sp.]|uniref:hypothetical protein n=1 Tax=unclassified Arcobacter TaxID=2593671 RepID=UPI003B00D867
MEKNKLKEILQIFYKTSTVNAIVRGERKPSYEIILTLNNDFNIPFDSWKDIKSYINETITDEEKESKYPSKEKVS